MVSHNLDSISGFEGEECVMEDNVTMGHKQRQGKDVD
jgi:hypothetical protein